MDSRVIFHRLVQRDMDGILRFYREEASDSVAERFFMAFLETVDRALSNPQEFHFANPIYRRANIPGFPYHFLYREVSYGIRVGIGGQPRDSLLVEKNLKNAQII